MPTWEKLSSQNKNKLKFKKITGQISLDPIYHRNQTIQLKIIMSKGQKRTKMNQKQPIGNMLTKNK